MSAEVNPAFKQSEVWVVPHDWTTARLGELTQEGRHIRYGVVQPGHLVMSGCLMLRSQDYSKGWRGADDMHRVSVQLEAQYKNAKLKAKDLVMTVVGAGIGQVESAPSWLEGAVLSRSTARIAIDNKKAEPLFIKYLLESPATQKQLLDCQKEGAQPVVSCPDLALFRMHCPPIEEQKLIAGALGKIDDLINNLDQLIAKKCDIQQATMQQLLTGQRRLPGFSGEWKVKRLGDHLSFLRNGTNSRAELTTEGDVRYLHYGDIHGSQHLLLNPAKTSMPCLPHEKAKRLDRLENGDLVFSDASEDLDGVGKSVEVQLLEDMELVSGLHTIAVRFDKNLMADGFKAYLQFIPAFRSHLRQLAAGTKVYATNRAHIASAELEVPEIEEQVAISTILSDMDTELSSLEARCDKARKLKLGMMQELLTGRIRLV